MPTKAYFPILIVVALLLAACGGNKDGNKNDDERDKSGDKAAKAKTLEARKNLMAIKNGALAYYMDSPRGSIVPLPNQFPHGAAGPTPPKGDCCKTDDKSCAPKAAQWTSEVWDALEFSVSDPHYYSYDYKADDKGFTARAYGDLDCDGTFSTFEVSITAASVEAGAVDSSPPMAVGGEFE